MFASLGVELSSAKSPEGMELIQKIVTTIQKVVYRFEGSLNKLVMDDKGSTLICVWGLSPMAHEDDATRAVMAAQMIRKKLKSPDINIWCCIGISTGVVFSGVVGTSGSRKEFSVLGDVVNVAARIMGHSKKEKGKIFVGFNTMREASPFLDFDYVEHCEFKGKSINLPIYEPIDVDSIAYASSETYLNPFNFLKLYANPFLVDRNLKYQFEYCKAYGRGSQMESAVGDILDFVTDLDESVLISVYGESGCGKTLFARALIDKLKTEPKIKSDWANKEKTIILASTLNCTTEKLFLNIWIPILRAMLDILKTRRNVKKEMILSNLFKNNEDIADKIFILEKIFDVELPKEAEQLVIKEEPLAFVQREKYAHDIEDPIIDFLSDFVMKEVLEEDKIEEGKANDTSHILEVPPIIVFLDNVYLMDKPSWELLGNLKKNCKRICFVLLVKVSPNHAPVLSAGAEEIAPDFLTTDGSCDLLIELSALEEEDLKIMLTDLSRQYEVQMKDEIKKMTDIIDPAVSPRTPAEATKMKNEMIKQYNVTDYFNDIEKEIMNVIMQKCEGNPLCSMQFLFNLMTSGMVTTKDKILYSSGKSFFDCYQKNDWTPLAVPDVMSSINGHLLDQYVKEGNKVNTNFMQDKVKGMILLKAAAVIGEVFTLDQLKAISPLIHDDIETIMGILNDLQNRDFIEVIDDNDAKNWSCRFTKKFLRETLYQRLLFRGQKKPLHQLSADYIQNHANLDSDYEIEQKRLLHHILVAEDKLSEDKLSSKARNALIVNRLNHKMIDKKSKIIKDGFLTKQGQKTNKNIEPRYVRLTRTELQWFHNQEEAKHNEVPLGSIPFIAISSIIAAKTDKVTSDIYIECTYWKKKNVEKPQRKFVFGAKTENERDDWITCIEFLRSNEITETFKKKFANVTFPVQPSVHKSKKVGASTTNFEGQTSLGLMLKKQGQFLPTQKGVLARGTGVKRASKFQGIFDKKRLSSFSLESFQAGLNQEGNIKDTVTKIKALFNVNMTYFFAQISENAVKGNAFSSHELGKVPECLRSVKFKDIPSYSPSVSMAGNIGLRKQQLEGDSPISMKGQLMGRGTGPFDWKPTELEAPVLELQRMKSAQPVGADLDANLSEEYYKNIQIRKSEKAPQLSLNPIQEQENELDKTADDLDRSRSLFPENKEDIGRKDRAATFKPTNLDTHVNAESTESPETMVKVQKAPKVSSVDQRLMKTIKNRIFKDDDFSNGSDANSDEERKIREELTKDERGYFGSKQHQRNKTKEFNVYVNDKEKDNFLNTSNRSSSKYSVHESEKFGDREYVVKTRKNDIKGAVIRKTSETERVFRGGNPSKGLSIQKIQKGLKTFQNNPPTINVNPDPHYQFDNSQITNSSQQARNMMNTLSEHGPRRNSPYSANMVGMFQPTPEMVGASAHSRSNTPSPMRANAPYTNESPQFNFHNPIAPNFGGVTGIPNEDPSQAMNPLFSQMMMLMQQNTALMAQQQEFIRTMSSGQSTNEKSRPRSRPRFKNSRNEMPAYDPNVESRTQIGITNYSELDDENIDDADRSNPENVRGLSATPERKKPQNVETYNLGTGYKPSRPKKIKKEAKKQKKVADKTIGIVMNNTRCMLNSDQILLEGSIVTIEKYLPDLNLYQIKHNNFTGLYPKKDIKISRKKGEQIKTKPGKSVERRMESLEREAKKRQKKRKKNNDMQEFEDDGYLAHGGPFSSRQSKDVDSQNEILPYNSLKQSDPYASIEDNKRMSKEGDFTKVSHKALEHLNENSEDEFESEGEKSAKVYFEPGKDSKNKWFNNSGNFAGENFLKPEDSYDSNSYPDKERKISKATKRKNKKEKNSFLSKPATFVEPGKTLMAPSHSHNPSNGYEGTNSSLMNESMSSNQSLNRSLKMAMRKNKKQARNPLGIPVKKPETYSGMHHMKTFNS